eukprot:6468072-Amphidinium_carterae.1
MLFHAQANQQIKSTWPHAWGKPGRSQLEQKSFTKAKYFKQLVDAKLKEAGNMEEVKVKSKDCSVWLGECKIGRFNE